MTSNPTWSSLRANATVPEDPRNRHIAAQVSGPLAGNGVDWASRPGQSSSESVSAGGLPEPCCLARWNARITKGDVRTVSSCRSG